MAYYLFSNTYYSLSIVLLIGMLLYAYGIAYFLERKNIVMATILAWFTLFSCIGFINTLSY